MPCPYEETPAMHRRGLAKHLCRAQSAAAECAPTKPLMDLRSIVKHLRRAQHAAPLRIQEITALRKQQFLINGDVYCGGGASEGIRGVEGVGGGLRRGDDYAGAARGADIGRDDEVRRAGNV